MIACYYSQGKQLASGVIGLFTCQSHYNDSVINTTPCARLLLRHSLDQRIPTRTCEWQVIFTLPAALHLHSQSPDRVQLHFLHSPDPTPDTHPITQSNAPVSHTIH